MTFIGGQSKSKGNTTFIMNWGSVSQVATVLPRNISECQIWFRYSNQNKGSRAFLYKVDPQLVRQALLWLIENDELYKDKVALSDNVIQELIDEKEKLMKELNDQGITLESICEEVDQQMRFTGMVGDALNSGIMSEVPHIIQQNYVQNGDRNEAQQPVEITRGGGLLQASKVTNLLGYAFPTLFRYGTEGNYKMYKVHMSTVQFFRHTMRFADPIFTQHYRFIFCMVNLCNLETAMKSIQPCLNGHVYRKFRDGEEQDVTEQYISDMGDKVCI